MKKKTKVAVAMDVHKDSRDDRGAAGGSAGADCREAAVARSAAVVGPAGTGSRDSFLL